RRSGPPQAEKPAIGLLSCRKLWQKALCGDRHGAEGKKVPGPGLWLGKRKQACYGPERENMHTLLLENERRRAYEL
ncbi:MAG: hypothetical protein ACLR9Z_08045, partial [Alitiscatomonas sp.]